MEISLFRGSLHSYDLQPADRIHGLWCASTYHNLSLTIAPTLICRRPSTFYGIFCMGIGRLQLESIVIRFSGVTTKQQVGWIGRNRCFIASDAAARHL